MLILSIQKPNPMKLNRFPLMAVIAGMTLYACGDSSETNSNAAAPDAPAQAAEQPMDPARQEAQAPAAPTTVMTFAEYEHDFGNMNEGDVVTHVFEFTNTGSEPLVISKCKGSCGCTVPVWPKEPIAPGATGNIEVKFNSKGKKNAQTKRVTIDANTDPAQTMLTIKAQVTPNPMMAK